MKYIKIVTREYAVQYADAITRSLSNDLRKYLPALIHNQILVPEGKNEACYFSKTEFEHYLESLKKHYFNYRKLKVFIRNFNYFGEKYEFFGKKYTVKQMAKLTNENLLNYYCEYFNLLVIYTGMLWTAYFINELYSEKINRLLVKHNITGNQKLVTSLLSPIKRTSVLLLQDEIIKLKKKGVLSKNNLNKLLNKYSWISCLDMHNDPWQSKDLQEYAMNVKIPQQAYPFSKALKFIDLNLKEKELFKTFREIIYIKDLRDEYRRRGIYNILPLFNELGRRLGLNRQQLAYFTEGELVNALKNNTTLDPEIAEKRKSGFLIYCKNNEVYITVEKLAIEKFLKNNLSTDDKDEKVVIKGVAASNGIISGKVRIVFGVKDLSKVQKGEIMVANTTHPDFVSAMTLAGAIITDEGGLTSHAAIVSRELGIPCIVGTKVATKVLKDGDLVEVDAVNGVVKKIF